MSNQPTTSPAPASVVLARMIRYEITGKYGGNYEWRGHPTGEWIRAADLDALRPLIDQLELDLTAQVEESRRLLRDRDAFWNRVESLEQDLAALRQRIAALEQRLRAFPTNEWRIGIADQLAAVLHADPTPERKA